MSYLKDGLKMLEELVYVRWNALTGVYSKPVKELEPPVPAARN
jgi:hypothetical protein